MSLSAASVQIQMSASEVIVSASGNNDVHGASFNPTFTNLTDGIGANKAQKVGRKVYGLTTGNLDIDFSAFAGGINDVPINFTKIREICLRNLDATIIYTIGGPAGTPVNAWTNYVNGTFTMNPGAVEATVDHSLAAMVVAGANKLLRCVAASGTPSLEVLAIGEGA